MSDTNTVGELTEGESHELLSPLPASLELPAGEEHLLITSGEEEYLLTPPDDTLAVMAEDTVEATQDVAPVLEPILEVSSGEDYFAEASPELTSTPQVVENPIAPEMDASIFDQFVSETDTTTPDTSVQEAPVVPTLEVAASVMEAGVVAPIVAPPSPPEPPQMLSSMPIAPSASSGQSSHKGILIAGAVSVALLLVVGVWLVFGGDSEKTGGVQYTISAEEPTTYEETVASQAALHEQDITQMNHALSQGDPQICETITAEDMKIECSETLRAQELAQSGAIEDCQTLTRSDIRLRCESTLAQDAALAAMDKFLCDAISDATQAQYCRENIDEQKLANLIETKTATDKSCKSLELKYQDSCVAAIARVDDNSILQSAVTDDNLEACQKLSTDELQYVCFDTILLKRALSSGDKNLCDYVRDETKKASCVSYTKTQDDNEVFKTAIIEKNLEMCTTIVNTSLKNRCHDSVILLQVRDTKNASLCDSLINTGTIESCKKSTGAQ